MRDEWYVARRGQGENARYGPVPLDQLRQLLDEGRVKPGDLVWREGMVNWQRADQCDGLFPLSAPPRGRAPNRDLRGYGPDDDLPYRRRYPPPRQSSSGWVVGLVVGGAVLAVCFLACAGLVFFSYLRARPAAPYVSSVTTPAIPVAPNAPGALADDMALVSRDFNGLPPPGLGQTINFGASEVLYTDQVTQEEAQNLGNYLANQGIFPNDHGASVQLDKSLGTYQVRFSLQFGANFDGRLVEARELRDDFADNLFVPGSTVEVHLCDQNMTTVRTIGPEN